MTSFAKNAVVLGLVSAVGPFAIDMYLPALPALAHDVHASAATAQLTLTAFFLAFGFFQLMYGPWSDAAGRKRPLLFGIGLFAVGSIGCLFAHDIGWLIGFRFLEGIGAAAPAVIPRAIIRDLHTGHEATRLMSLVMLVFSVSPILAPLVGSAIIVPFGWRAIFGAVTILGLACMALLGPYRETLPAAERAAPSLRATLADFGALLRDARFVGLTLTGGFGMSCFFVFLAGSPFLYINHFGLTTTQYSFAFSINAIGFIGASQFASRIGMRFGLVRLILAAAAVFATFACALAVLVVLGFASLPVLIVMLFLTFANLGLVIPTTMVLALEHYGRIAGSAAALSGTLQMLTGGVVIALAGLVLNASPAPMVLLIALFATMTLITVVLTVMGAMRGETHVPAVGGV